MIKHSVSLSIEFPQDIGDEMFSMIDKLIKEIRLINDVSYTYSHAGYKSGYKSEYKSKGHGVIYDDDNLQ